MNKSRKAIGNRESCHQWPRHLEGFLEDTKELGRDKQEKPIRGRTSLTLQCSNLLLDIQRVGVG